MRQVVTVIVTIGSLAGVMTATVEPRLPQRDGQSASAKLEAIRACSLLPKAEVKRIAAANDQFFDMVPPKEESLASGGSSCAYSGIHIQVNPFTPARLEELRKEKGALWAAVPDVGDAAYLFDNNNSNAGLHYAELYTRVGQHVLTIQMSVRPATASVEAVRPAVVTLAKALVAKLR
jgi:hypothetical protein